MKAEKTLTRGPATELIHAGEGGLGIAVPLTTPIYETTTFVFNSAAEVLAYNEGRSTKYLYSRYTNPTVVSVERKLATLDHAGLPQPERLEQQVTALHESLAEALNE